MTFSLHISQTKFVLNLQFLHKPVRVRTGVAQHYWASWIFLISLMNLVWLQYAQLINKQARETQLAS